MNKKDEQDTKNPGVSRRNVLKSGAGLALTAAYGGSILGQADEPPAAGNLIEQENAKPGTQDWRLTNTSTVGGLINGVIANGRSPAIEGYCSANSIRAGETLKVMVSTNPASDFNLEIFRTGYYNGDGGRLVRTYNGLPSFTQLDPDIGENYLRECQWSPSVEFEIPSDWLSGVYLGKLTALSSGLQSYVIFIVRDDRPCDFLFQCSEMTWSAYNRWPVDYAVYTKHAAGWNGSGIPSGTVSFDRPYALFTHPVNKITKSVGAGEFLPWEFPLSFWLEQNGYDVSYISNIDTHADGPGLLRAKGFLSVGHDEYWTQDMFDNVLNARDEGVSLAFLCGNAVIGKVPLLHSTDGRPNRAIRREGWFVPVAAGQEVPPPLLHYPEYEADLGPDGALLLGARHPIGSGQAGLGQGVGDWTCTAPEHLLFAGTGMQAGDSIESLVGWEFHGEPLMSLPGMQILAEGPAHKGGQQTGTYTATIYDGPQGNIVFNAATIWWANGLSSPPGHINPSRHGVTQQGPDPRVQQITKNVLARMITGPIPGC
ncbi:hypothetical protein OAN12_08320 [Halioglobus sp.]|nr:hypothetical protein [Halioglobus sp.]